VVNMHKYSVRACVCACVRACMRARVCVTSHICMCDMNLFTCVTLPIDTCAQEP